MSFHIRFFSLINKNRVVKSVTEKDANLIILRLTPLVVSNGVIFIDWMLVPILHSQHLPMLDKALMDPMHHIE